MGKKFEKQLREYTAIAEEVEKRRLASGEEEKRRQRHEARVDKRKKWLFSFAAIGALGALATIVGLFVGLHPSGDNSNFRTCPQAIASWQAPAPSSRKNRKDRRNHGNQTPGPQKLKIILAQCAKLKSVSSLKLRRLREPFKLAA